MENNKTFYFFIENEFVCRPNLNLERELIKNQNYSAHAITVNLVEFSSVNEMKVYKIYSNFPKVGLQENDMQEFYKQIGLYVKLNFICDDESKIFLGCVRDDNETHTNLNIDNLGFENRTDPIHDIFNVLKNIYIGNFLRFVDDKDQEENLIIVLNDLTTFIRKLEPSQNATDNALPIVGYFDAKRITAEERARRIWIPNINYKLEAFIEPLKYLFSINYYEKLLKETGCEHENLDVKKLLEFIILLKNLLNFQNEIVNDGNIHEYQEYLAGLSKYKFENGYLRCLDSLKHSIETNIKFFVDYKIPFKPIWFSTQMIEAEKGFLRYQNCNTPPTIAECVNWFEKAFNGGVDEIGYSEFGKCALKFDPRPNQITLMLAEGIDALCADTENLRVG